MHSLSGVKYTRLQADEDAERTGMLVDDLTNVAAIQSYAREDQELSAYTNKVARVQKLVIKGQRISSTGSFTVNLVFYAIATLLPLLYIAQTYDGSTSAARIFLIYSSIAILAKRIASLTASWSTLEKSLVAGVKGLEILQIKSKVRTAKGAKTLKVSKGQIEFKGMDFTYEKASSRLFKDLNLVIKPGEHVGLVGPSGGGKTTLLKLVMHFVDPTGGCIAIDGQDISKVTQASLRSAISYIPQEPMLFHRTVYENIAYGHSKATRKQVIASAKKANAHEFIKDLPNGYDTVVGERGIKPSGGQRQRVAIARAFLKDSPILIMDEATSALDSESEQLIQESLKELIKDRSVISVAHRLSTLRIMDRLLVIKDGQIVQQGKHSALVKSKGIYARLWSLQSGEFLK